MSDGLIARLRSIAPCQNCGEYPGGDNAQIMDMGADEIETLRERIAELDIDVAAWTNTAHILDSRAEKAEARIAELEKKLEGMADLAQGEFSRAEKAEAALTEARARLAAADRMAEALELVLKRCGPRATDGEIGRLALQAYRKETGQ